jgi:hypothetical protein
MALWSFLVLNGPPCLQETFPVSFLPVPGAAVLLAAILVVGAVSAEPQAIASDPVDGTSEGSRPPILPPDLSSAATGGYWEEGERNGIRRVIVVNRGRE